MANDISHLVMLAGPSRVDRSPLAGVDCHSRSRREIGLEAGRVAEAREESLLR